MARAAPAAGAGAHGVVLVLHDITDLRRADQIRRDFVANVSHELRTPLTAIRGYVEALSDGDADAEERAAVPRDHRAAHAADGAAGQGSAAAGAPRRRPGDARARRLRHAQPRRRRRRRSSRRRSRRATSASRSTIAPGAATVRARSGEAARRAAQPGRQRDHLLARADDDPRSTRRRSDGRIDDRRCPTRARAFPTRICRACSSASIASTSRARAIPAAPASASRS